VTSNRIFTAWESYRCEVLPKTAGPVQLKECRRSFYAGAEAMLSTVLGGLTPGPNATAQDETYLASIQAELMEFVGDVREGKA
jgi:hypothetical protein